jgi:preprotein translocase subunit SecY
MLRAFRDAFRVPDLQRKFLFTILLIGVYRLGNAIPTPGINPQTISQASGTAGGLLNLISAISGGNLAQFSIFALGVLPYITASIIFQLVTTAIPALEKLSKEGEEGRKKINQYTRYAAIIIGALQSLFLSIFVLQSSNGLYLLPGWSPGLSFTISVVITQVAGVALAMWIGERISEVGIGNGISLIIFIGIVSRFPQAFSSIFVLYHTGQVPLLSLVAFIAILLAAVVAIVWVYQAERRLPVQYARKDVPGLSRRSSGQQTYLPVKLNMAGVIPAIFAAAMLSIPSIVQNATQVSHPQVADFIARWLSLTSSTGVVLEVLLIIGFTYLYNSIQFDPRRIAESLREAGGFIPGVRPGQATADYLSAVSNRISLWGALFLGALVLIPQLLQNVTGISGAASFAFSGTGLLIVVGVALDTLKQVEAQLTVRRYDGFISKGRLRGGR